MDHGKRESMAPGFDTTHWSPGKKSTATQDEVAEAEEFLAMSLP
jgi:hypothetical protein